MRLGPACCLVAVAAVCAACPKPNCTVNAQCAKGLVCADENGDGQRTCVNQCAADLRCPGGQACIQRDDGSLEGACLVVTGAKKSGDTCTSDRQCATGACSEGSCVDTCDVHAKCTSADDRCTLDGLRYVCVPPTGDVATGDPCASSTDCTSGTCVVPPDATDAQCADNCAVDVACSASDVVCVRLEGGARACLVPLVDGSACQDNSECDGGFCITDFDGTAKCASACDQGACADGFACESAADSNGDGTVDANDTPACMPVLDTRASGETCAHARECASLHCAHFASGSTDLGTLCADPCGADNSCAAPDVCWADPNPNGTNVCGPAPP